MLAEQRQAREAAEQARRQEQAAKEELQRRCSADGGRQHVRGCARPVALDTPTHPVLCAVLHVRLCRRHNEWAGVTHLAFKLAFLKQEVLAARKVRNIWPSTATLSTAAFPLSHSLAWPGTRCGRPAARTVARSSPPPPALRVACAAAAAAGPAQGGGGQDCHVVQAPAGPPAHCRHDGAHQARRPAAQGARRAQARGGARCCWAGAARASSLCLAGHRRWTTARAACAWCWVSGVRFALRRRCGASAPGASCTSCRWSRRAARRPPWCVPSSNPLATPCACRAV